MHFPRCIYCQSSWLLCQVLWQRRHSKSPSNHPICGIEGNPVSNFCDLKVFERFSLIELREQASLTMQRGQLLVGFLFLRTHTFDCIIPRMNVFTSTYRLIFCQGRHEPKPAAIGKGVQRHQAKLVSASHIRFKCRCRLCAPAVSNSNRREQLRFCIKRLFQHSKLSAISLKPRQKSS